MKHSFTNEFCTVAHFDGEGNALPPCRLCKVCETWIAPESTMPCYPAPQDALEAQESTSE